MIVCVLLVSNSRGCCLAAPGDHEGAARVIAPRRDSGETTPEGVWHQQYTHNHVWSLKQAITWANVDPDLCHQMVSLGLNGLTVNYQAMTVHWVWYHLAIYFIARTSFITKA